MTKRTTGRGGHRAVAVLRDGWLRFELDEVPWPVQVQVVRINGRPELVGLRLEAELRAPVTDFAVTSERLRSLPLRQIRETAFAVTQGDFAAGGEALRRVERTGNQRWPDEHFAQVAEVYRRAVAVGRSPLKEIATHWSVSRPAAAKYVRRARELGLLGYPERPGVAGADRPTSPIGGGAPTSPPRRSTTMRKKKID